MKRFAGSLAIVGAAALIASGCNKGKPEAGQPAGQTAAAPVAANAAEQKAEKPVPYAYPPPVKGHYKEINIGSFDLVDGIAYPSARGAGTVVYATSKPIASPVLAGSPCPMTQARFLTQLRDSRWVEVPVGASGKSRYFAAGTAFDGSSREEDSGGHYFSAKGKLDGGRISGSVRHKQYGSLEFDLPVSTPQTPEVSQADYSNGTRGSEGEQTPGEQEVTAAYTAVRAAALQRDLRGLLAAQGFDQKQIAAIRGLDGIDADLAVYADRFLEPGTAGEFTKHSGVSYVKGEGTNSKGKKFVNFYWFAPCKDQLVLVSISENPQ